MTSPEPRPRDAEATRLRLLIAARRRFGVLGFDRTTTRDIATDADVNVSLISRYFGSKDGLYAAVLAESAELIAPGLDDTGGGREGLLDAVVDGLRPGAWDVYGDEHPLMLMLRDTGTDPAIDDLRRTSMAAWVESIAQRLHLDPARAELVTAALTGMVVLHSVMGDQLSVARDEAVLREELRRMLDLLAPDDRTS